MKKMKKFLAVMLAAIMVMSMGTSVFADLNQASSGTSSGTSSVTITGVASSNHTFTAYQIFKGTYSGGVLSDIDWGDCVNDNTLLTYLTTSNAEAYNDGTSYTWASVFNGCTTAESVAKILTNNSTNTSLIKAFAALLATEDGGSYTYLTNYSASTNSGAVSGTTYNYTISGLDAGYYLITDSYTGAEVTDDAKSAYFLQVAGTTSISTKTVVPTVSKTVTNTTGTESSATSASAGDTVSFTLVGSVPSDVASYYTDYTYKFVDTLSSNLTYNSTTDVTVQVYNDSACTDSYATLTDTAVSGAYYLATETSGTITIEIYNALTLAGKYIKVTYNATVETGITSGYAETNTVYVEYSNDPTNCGTGGSTGKTTEKKVYVYTFDLDVNKTDGDDNTVSALESAGFTLYKLDSSVDNTTDFTATKYYTISGTTATEASSYTSGTEYYVSVSTDTVGSDYKLTFSSLGEGKYALVESTTPEGYNTAAAVIFTITATYATDGNAVTKLTTDNSSVSAGSSVTTLSTTIKNYVGTTIPTTGGIGTTMFYVVGMILVLGAAVVLVTRRRMTGR